MSDLRAAHDLIPSPVLARWSNFRTAAGERCVSGLINDTFVVRTPEGSKAIVQRLHEVFAPTVNLDLAAITSRLAAQGLLTPELIPADDGELWVMHEGRCWRALTYIVGRTHQRVPNLTVAHEAGALVGRFHRALSGLEHRYQFTRGNIHDTAAHLRTLRAALAQHRTHALATPVAELAKPLLAAAAELTDFAALPPRHAHGDLKISNLLFDPEDHALCLIDLDTLSRMAWPLEMGDALRSWCNPREEDRASPELDLDLLEAAMTGYASAAHGLISSPERGLLIEGLAQICLELAARFLADALRERYFGWDAERYATRGAHNLHRANAMWGLYRSVRDRQREAERIVRGFA